MLHISPPPTITLTEDGKKYGYQLIPNTEDEDAATRDVSVPGRRSSGPEDTEIQSSVKLSHVAIFPMYPWSLINVKALLKKYLDLSANPQAQEAFFSESAMMEGYTNKMKSSIQNQINKYGLSPQHITSLAHEVVKQNFDSRDSYKALCTDEGLMIPFGISVSSGTEPIKVKFDLHGELDTQIS